MKRINVLSAAVILTAFVFTSCQKDDTGNSGPSVLGVKLEALNKSYNLPVTLTKSAEVATASVTWDTITMVVSKVSFEAELKSKVSHRDSVEISYKWSGPVTANLLDSKTTFGNFTLQPGYYDEIEIKVAGLKDDAKPKPVFFMSGIYTNSNNQKITIKVKVSDDIMLSTEKDSVNVTGDQVDYISYIQVYLDKLMAGVPVSALDNAKLTDGKIIISADTNREIYYLLTNNLYKKHHMEHHEMDKDEFEHMMEGGKMGGHHD